jgi:hypothetical protein
MYLFGIRTQRDLLTESRRVYRRVFCSNVRRLYQERSSLHRRPPPLLVAWRDVSDGAVQAFRCPAVVCPSQTMRGGVVPVHPFQGFPFDPTDGFPWAEEVDDFGFEQANRAFGQRVVHCPAGDACIAERGMNRRHYQRKGRSRFQPIALCTLWPDIANHDPNGGSNCLPQKGTSDKLPGSMRLLPGRRMQSMLPRGQHKAGCHRSGDPPAYDPAGKNIDDESDVDHALPTGNIGKVRYLLPGSRYVVSMRGQSLFGPGATNSRFTLSSGQGCEASGLVVTTFLPRTTPCIAMAFIHCPAGHCEAMFREGAFYGAAGDILPLSPKRVPNLARTITTSAGIEGTLDIFFVHLVAFGSIRRQIRGAVYGRPRIECRLSANACIRLPANGMGDRQYPANRPDPKDIPVVPPSRACEHALPGKGQTRSSLERAVELRLSEICRCFLLDLTRPLSSDQWRTKVSSWRSSRFSRSRALSLALSSLVKPDRSPASRSACWHQARRLSAEQPSLGAIARYAALSLA